MPSERTGPVAGVVLAAGISARMGQNKLLIEFGGEPIVRRAVRRAREAGLDPVLVVLGHEADLIRAAIRPIECDTIVNADYAAGVNSSLRTGIASVAETPARAAVVMLADMPFVTDTMLRMLVDEYRRSDAPLVVSDYDGVDAPPMLYDRSLFEELAATDAQGCGRHVVKRHRHEARSLPWPAAALADLDVPEDVERARGAAGD